MVTWTNKEEELLRQFYGRKKTPELAKQLGRSVDAVRHRARRLELSTYSKRKWTAEEDRLLHQFYGEMPTKTLADHLGRSAGSVCTRVSMQIPDLRFQKRWAESEIRQLIALHESCSDMELGAVIGRTAASVKGKRQELGLPGKCVWTDDELDVLRTYYPCGIDAVASRINRSKHVIKTKAGQLKLRVVKWTAEEEDLLREFYGKMRTEDLAAQVGRGVWAVYSRSKKLGLSRPLWWTAEEKNLLRQYYGKMRTKDLAAKMGRSEGSLHNHASLLGLRGPRGRPRKTA